MSSSPLFSFVAPQYEPSDWYWIRSDGAVFASARIAIVAEDDEDYQGWLGAGYRPSLWPHDEAGNETIEALQSVLAPWGLFASLEAYVRNRSYEIRLAGAEIAGVPLKGDESTIGLLNGLVASATRNPDATFSFDDGANGKTLTAAQAIDLAAAFGDWVQGTFTARIKALAGIKSGRIKTRADADAALAKPAT